MNRSTALEILGSHFSELEKQFRVASLSLFGSVARDEAGPDSDVDVLVEFFPEAHVGLFEFIRLQQRLEELLSRRVDLGTPTSLKPRVRDQVLREAIHVS